MGNETPQKIPSWEDGMPHYGHTPRCVNSPAGAPQEPKSMRKNAKKEARIRHERQARRQQLAQEQAMQQQAMQQQMAFDQGFTVFQGLSYDPMAGWGLMNPAFGVGILDRVMPAIQAWDAKVPASVEQSAGFGFADPRTSNTPDTALIRPHLTSNLIKGITSAVSETLDDPYTSNVSPPAPSLRITATNNEQKLSAYKKQEMQSAPQKSALPRLPANIPTGPKALRDVEVKAQKTIGDRAEEVKKAVKSIAKGPKKKRKTKQQRTETKEQRKEMLKNRSLRRTHGRVQKEKARRDERENDIAEKVSKNSKTNKQHSYPTSLRPRIPARISSYDTRNANNLLWQQGNEGKLLQRQHEEQLEQLKCGKFNKDAYLEAGGGRKTWGNDKKDLHGWMADRHCKERIRLEHNQKKTRDIAFGATDASSPAGSTSVREAVGQCRGTAKPGGIHGLLPIRPIPCKDADKKAECPEDIRDLRSMTKGELLARQAGELDELCQEIFSEEAEEGVDKQDAAADVTDMEQRHSRELHEWHSIRREIEGRREVDQASKRKRSVSVQFSEQRKCPRVEGTSAASNIAASPVGFVEEFFDAVEKQVQPIAEAEGSADSGIEDGEWIGDGLMSLLG